MAKSENRNSGLIMLICIVGCIIIVMIGLYCYNFWSAGLSVKPEDWGYFGSYIGSVMSLLAFIGVLWTIHITRAQQKEQEIQYVETTERDSFFKMLDLHNRKFESVALNEHFGVEAFKNLTDITNTYIQHIILYQILIEDFENDKCKGYGRFLQKRTCASPAYIEKHGTQNYLEILFNSIEASMVEMNIITPKALSDNQELLLPILKLKLKVSVIPLIDNIDIKLYADMALTYREEMGRNFTVEHIYQVLKITSQKINEEYGHILDQYFRNFYYTMKIISNFKSCKSNNYAQVFRAQLSRSEINMHLVNAVGSKSEYSMIQLLEEYNVFKDIYPDELYLFHIPINIKDSEIRHKSTIKQLLTLSKNK